MEYATFAHTLQRVRTARLNQMLSARRALVMGDGDGRFLQALLAANPTVRVDAIDASATMLRLAKQRAASLGSETASRVTWHHANVLLWQPPDVPRGTSPSYDLIVTHFFLDCFSSAELAGLISRISASMSPGSPWIHSDFAIPPRGLMRWPSYAIVGALYLSFRVLTGLTTSHLPDDTSAFTQVGLALQSQEFFLGGLLKSELWRKPDF